MRTVFYHNEGSNKWGGITYIRYQARELHYLRDELVTVLTR